MSNFTRLQSAISRDPATLKSVALRAIRFPTYRRIVGDARNKSTRLPWHDDKGFRNVPAWGSHVSHTVSSFFLKALPKWRWSTKFYPLPVDTPDWPSILNPTSVLQAFWIGHATFLLQAHGFNILTDPIFSHRSSPSQLFGPARFTPAACTAEELPPVDLVLISHNHYDHVDATSVRALLRKERADLAAAEAALRSTSGGGGAGRRFEGTLWVCPLRVGALLASLGVAPSRILELDWWQSTPAPLPPAAAHPPSRFHAGAWRRSPHWDLPTYVPQPPAAPPGDAPPGGGGGGGGLEVVAVPAQHSSARTPWDRDRTLWAGFVVLAHPAGGGAASPLRIYFAGDTGFRAVPDDDAPEAEGADGTGQACPVFDEIGARLGPLDVALLPIGAYSPRSFMSPVHASPEDAAEMHVRLGARASLAMHWGTFPLTDEPPEEPPRRLAAALRRRGVDPAAFVALRHGALWRPPPAAAAGPGR